MKKTVLVLTIYSGLALAQNSNNNVGQAENLVLKESRSGNLQEVYFIPYSEPENQNSLLPLKAQGVYIRLNSLTSRQKAQAEQIGKKNASSDLNFQTLKIRSSSYRADPQVKDLNNFYRPGLKIHNQGAFGSCVTYATMTGLSYASTKKTDAASIPSVLFQREIDSGGNPVTSGWDGLQLPQEVLEQVLDRQKGYYRSKDVPWIDATYANLSITFNNFGVAGSDYAETPGFGAALSKYKNFAAVTPTKQFTNVSYQDLGLKAGSTNNTTIVKSALASGHKVLIGFTVYDSNQPSSCPRPGTIGDGAFNYNVTSGVLSEKHTPPRGNNAWIKSEGCILGGHEVLVVGDYQDANGNIIFVIRNSWGRTGDQGNYYMSADYLNNATDSGVELISSGSIF